MDLPVLIGPPPYRAKRAAIIYLVKLAGGYYPDTLLTKLAAEKALVNLSNPLVVSDELQMSRHKVCLTAGIHRQTWISGYLLFVDLQIDNQSTKPIKKVEVQLEKATTYYVCSAPSLGMDFAEVLRLPDYIEKEILLKKAILESFQSIRPSTQDFRTAQMEIPTGLVSIEAGRFFGIRYFVNIQISCSFGKRLKVQLPITIVHPNSIDIPPNALAQVTASIEHEHRNTHTSSTGTGSPYRYRPGQAFTAARRQSIQQLRKQTMGSAEIESLTRALDASPRRFNPARQATTPTSTGSPSKMKITRRQSSAVLRSNGFHHRRRSSQRASFDDGVTYHYPRLSVDIVKPAAEHRVSFEDGAGKGGRSSLERGTQTHLPTRASESINRGPRLQRGTSGLAFDDSDKENRFPKKD
ncbi:MAG: hypothetical protein Q9217_006576, partial [Psora testacea]